ncbi:MAG: hypothetical protein ACLUEK_09490 [Oscillospiraceae bacterium]
MLITHEHADHVSACPCSARRHASSRRVAAARLRACPAVADYIDVIRALEPFTARRGGHGLPRAARHGRSVGYRTGADFLRLLHGPRLPDG